MLLVLFTSQTKGCVAFEKYNTGNATRRAIFSAFNKPMRLGINSPNTIDKKVTIITMMVVDIGYA
jgi:hypothetical protein